MKVIPMACLLLFLQPAFSQYNWSELDRKLEENQRLLGDHVVVMVWNGDSLLHKKEMGGFNARTQAPIASCSKWLTAALVMQFADEGKLSLDDRVEKYIPEFGNYFKSSITIRQCLSHMTGIADDEKFIRRILERRKFASLEEEINAFARRDIRARPGTDFWYGNVGLNIAGRVLELISKKKFDLLIQAKLFLPLGMTRTSFTDQKGNPVNPSGGARSTAEDYMKFLVMLLNKGKYNGRQILSEKAVELMMEVQAQPNQVSYAPKAAEGYGYALGTWVIESAWVQPPGSLGRTIPPSSEVVPRKKYIATAVASPGLFGTWPMIDYCRGYAYIVFVKNLLGEQRAEVHKEIKKILDRQLTSTCDSHQ